MEIMNRNPETVEDANVYFEELVYTTINASVFSKPGKHESMRI